MREIIKLDSIPKALSFLTGIGSLILLIYGLYIGSYWAGFGLVLLMTSIIVILGLTGAQEVVSSKIQKEIHH